MAQAEAKATRREIRKAFGPETTELIATIAQSQEAHEHNLGLVRDWINAQNTERARLAGSFWARLKWIAVGR